MTNDAWVLAADPRRVAPMVAAARGSSGRVTVVALGDRTLADTAAAAGPDSVRWVEPAPGRPAEAYAASLADAVAAASPRVVLATATPAGRLLLGFAAAALGAAVVPGVLQLACAGDTIVVERLDLGGRVAETLEVRGPLAGLFGGDDAPASGSAATAAPVERLELAPGDLCIERTQPVAGGSGLKTADRVVAIGRGLKARDDLAIVERLAAVLRAEIACSMPIADDFGWVAKERYVGRSGQQIAPRLYVALGISGMPQHLEGIRDAKTVVAVNNDAEARIFGRADYGIVGDLYEVVPALVAALGK